MLEPFKTLETLVKSTLDLTVENTTRIPHDLLFLQHGRGGSISKLAGKLIQYKSTSAHVKSMLIVRCTTKELTFSMIGQLCKVATL